MYWIFFGLFCAAIPHYNVGDWINLRPNASSGQYLDSVEYQMLLPAAKFYGVDGRKRDLTSFKSFLRANLANVDTKSHESIRLVTLYDLSLMDPSQDQTEAETEWELKQRTTLDGSNVGVTDLTIKRGAVPDFFDWYPDYTPIIAVGAIDVENKFELDIQCAERDYTQATKFTFPPGVVPILKMYRNLQDYFPKLFQVREVHSHLGNRVNSPLPIGEISFEWNGEVKADVSGLEVTFVFGTRHLSFESAVKGEEGWALRPPELNFRVKRKNLPATKQQQAALLTSLEQLFNALLASEWNAHEDCGQWNGRKSCPPGFLSNDGKCVSSGCERSAAPVTKIPRGASSASIPPSTKPLSQTNTLPSSSSPFPNIPASSNSLTSPSRKVTSVLGGR